MTFIAMNHVKIIKKLDTKPNPTDFDKFYKKYKTPLTQAEILHAKSTKIDKTQPQK